MDDVPRLLNLHDDPQLNHTVQIVLTPGHPITIGRPDSTEEMDIKLQACILKYKILQNFTSTCLLGSIMLKFIKIIAQCTIPGDHPRLINPSNPSSNALRTSVWYPG